MRRTLKTCRVSDPQLACLIFFSTVYVLKVSINTIYLYHNNPFSLCPATPRLLYLIIGILLFNNRGVLESQTVPGQLSDRMFQSISISAGLTTILQKSDIESPLLV